MDAAHYQKIKNVFNQVIDLPVVERDAFLAFHCSDPGIRSEVLKLLAAAESSEDFLETPVTGQISRVLVDHQIKSLNQEFEGRFRLLRLLGEGGMGVVFLARQLEPVTRLVAMKIMNHTASSSEKLLNQFEAERQVLAQMNHPQITKIYEAGVTAGNSLYFVMEYVDGEPLIEFCNHRNLSIRKRLRLFYLICKAVQHAHLQGFIHRDLKPSNVLVTDRDGEPVPKVIDFGIATNIPDESSVHGPLGDPEIWIGTPAYMSPEQLHGDRCDIDTRADIYALGVLLFELMTDRLPRRMRSHGLGEEGDPEAPTTPITWILADKAGLAASAAFRSCGPKVLARWLREPLAQVWAKTLHRDREKRYQSVAELIVDLEYAFRSGGYGGLGQPPRARFSARERVLVFAGHVAVLCLVFLLALWAAKQKQSTENELHQKRLALGISRVKAIQMEVVNNFLRHQLADIKPVGPFWPSQAKVHEWLAAMAAALYENLATDAYAQQRIFKILSLGQENLGNFEAALELAQVAFDMGLPPDSMAPRNNRETTNLLMRMLLRTDRLEQMKGIVADGSYGENGSSRGRNRPFLHPDTELAESLLLVAAFAVRQRRFLEAERLLRNLMGVVDDTEPPSPFRVRCAFWLGEALAGQDQRERARLLFTWAAGRQKGLFGSFHHDTLLSQKRAGEMSRVVLP